MIKHTEFQMSRTNMMVKVIDMRVYEFHLKYLHYLCCVVIFKVTTIQLILFIFSVLVLIKCGEFYLSFLNSSPSIPQREGVICKEVKNRMRGTKRGELVPFSSFLAFRFCRKR